MFDPIPADGGSAQRVGKDGLDKSSSRDLRQGGDAMMGSSSVQREIAAQESDRQLSFAGDNSFANQGAEVNNFTTFMVTNSHRGAAANEENDVGVPLDRA